MYGILNITCLDIHKYRINNKILRYHLLRKKNPFAEFQEAKHFSINRWNFLFEDAFNGPADGCELDSNWRWWHDNSESKSKEIWRSNICEKKIAIDERNKLKQLEMGMQNTWKLAVRASQNWSKSRKLSNCAAQCSNSLHWNGWPIVQAFIKVAHMIDSRKSAFNLKCAGFVCMYAMSIMYMPSILFDYNLLV